MSFSILELVSCSFKWRAPDRANALSGAKGRPILMDTTMGTPQIGVIRRRKYMIINGPATFMPDFKLMME
jgi:hypothetical protein